MMSSPAYGSSFLSRTNSGHSNLSFQTYSSSITPLSQQQPFQFSPHKVAKKSDSNFPPYAARGYQPGPAPMLAWNPSPHPAPVLNGDLPPLRDSPNAQRMVDRGRIHPQTKPKWKKSSTYAAQFKQRQNWNRELAQSKSTSSKANGDVMKDFPMRDYRPPRAEYLYHGSSESSDVFQSTMDGHVSSAMRDASDVSRFRPDFHVRFNQKSNHAAAAPSGGALPQEAYKAQEITPRSMTKELSATSLRRLNQQMRQEMQALDDQINSYQKTIGNQSKKKIPAT
uniref:Uncharacterized protein LOC101243494 n=1 Tax=Phallusia mammillata TaxID=59560 RepID=A0A6F9DI41_9ASCI|nr:uncharacterized protein LOC101243494 [Phallusia mammillata]